MKLTIEINEQQEAAIKTAINDRKDFYIDGGRVIDSDGKHVFLKTRLFRFFKDAVDNSQDNDIDKSFLENIKPDSSSSEVSDEGTK